MTRKQKKNLTRIILSAVLLLAAWALESFVLPDEGIWKWVSLACFLIPYFLVGWDVLRTSAINIAHGQVFDENFLMSVATIGAFFTGEYPEAVFVMLFFEVGELFESVAVGRSRKSIASLMDIRPDEANVIRDGTVSCVSPDEVAVGETILIRPGEKVPIDGVILEGSTNLNTTALTGESVPREVTVGDSVISGCVNMSGVITVKTTKAFGESTVSKILDLVENASAVKSRSENFITRFARWYTPIVVFSALALAIIPPLFVGDWMEWLHRALIFLVVSCPCALVISVPLSFFGGLGGASRQGVLVKGSNYLEALANTEIVAFDKTGTLTRGVFSVTAVHPETINEEELLEIAAAAEDFSSHPISLSLREANHRAIHREELSEAQEIAGQGVSVMYRGHRICVGNGKLMDAVGAKWHACYQVGTTVHVASDGEYMGHIVISDLPKEDSAAAIAELHRCGVMRTVMLTGDGPQVAESVAKQVGVDEYHASLLPADKVSYVEKILQDKSSRGVLAFVGDGINDAPVLARADIGIAMGALGSDAAIEAADVVLMDDRLSKLPLAIGIARKTVRIVYQNIILALLVKGVVLALGAIGAANLWWAVFADVGVLILAVLNAMRALRFDA